MLLLVNNSNNILKYSYINKLREAIELLNIPYYETTSLDDNILKLKGKIKGIILSGSFLKLTDEILFKKFANNIRCMLEFEVPVLGICFGCQLLSMIFGGNLVNKHKFFCETTGLEFINNKLFYNLHDKNVQFCFSDLPIIGKKDGVKEIAWFYKNDKKHCCAFEFRKDKYYGTLFHPEFYNSSHQILENFYYKICIKK